MLQETQQHYYNLSHQNSTKSLCQLINQCFIKEKEYKETEIWQKKKIAPEWQNPRRDRYPPRSQCMLQGCVLDYLQNRLAFVHLWIYIIKYQPRRQTDRYRLDGVARRHKSSVQ